MRLILECLCPVSLEKTLTGEVSIKGICDDDDDLGLRAVVGRPPASCKQLAASQHETS